MLQLILASCILFLSRKFVTKLNTPNEHKSTLLEVVIPLGKVLGIDHVLVSQCASVNHIWKIGRFCDL